MKRQVCQLSLIFASAALAPAVFAGTDIVKCIDASGHVTLTDQPCRSGTTSVRLASEPPASAGSSAQAYPLLAERNAVPPADVRPANWQRPQAKARPLARDVATLKAARVQFLLGDGADKPRLAGLE
jgi:hypothetical protein